MPELSIGNLLCLPGKTASLTPRSGHGKMGSMLPVLFLAGWLTATQEAVLKGEAAFSYRIEEAAATRGIMLTNPGCALMGCGDLGRDVWMFVGGAWVGPLTSVDCAQAEHYELNLARGRVVDLPWSLWQELGLPLDVVPAVVSFESVPPWARPGFEVRHQSN